MQIHWGLQFYVLTYVATFVFLVLSSSYYQRLWRAGAPQCAPSCFPLTEAFSLCERCELGYRERANAWQHPNP